MGLITSAENEYNKGLAIEPANLNARIGMATLFSSRNQLDKAIEELKKAQITDPANKDIHRLLAETYAKKGDAKNADYESLLAGMQVKTAVVPQVDHMRQGDELLKAKEYDKAATEYKAALKDRTDWPEALQKLGEAQMAGGHDDEAIASYREAIRLKAGNGILHYNLGVLYERKALLDEAVVEYRQALTYAADNGDARRRLADIYTLRGSFPQAIEQYRELLKLRKDNPLIHFKLAKVFVNSKDYPAAIAEYQETLKDSPDFPTANGNLGLLYLQQGLSDKAAVALSRAIEGGLADPR